MTTAINPTRIADLPFEILSQIATYGVLDVEDVVVLSSCNRCTLSVLLDWARKRPADQSFILQTYTSACRTNTFGSNWPSAYFPSLSNTCRFLKRLWKSTVCVKIHLAKSSHGADC